MAVSPEVEASVAALPGVATERIQGPDRYATAAAFGAWALDAGRATTATVGVATGLGFADALAGGAAIGADGGLLLMTRPSELSAPSAAFLETRCDTATRIVLFGGDVAVSGRAAWGIDEALSRHAGP